MENRIIQTCFFIKEESNNEINLNKQSKKTLNKYIKDDSENEEDSLVKKQEILNKKKIFIPVILHTNKSSTD